MRLKRSLCEAYFHRQVLHLGEVPQGDVAIAHATAR
jgi:hypothetical protein